MALSSPEHFSAVELLDPELIVKIAGAEDILALPEANEERNQRIDEIYGETARTLALYDDRRMAVHNNVRPRSTTMRAGPNNNKIFMNALLRYPDNWIRLMDYRPAMGINPSTVYSEMPRRLGQPPIVEEMQQDGLIAIRLAPDLKVVDLRTEPPDWVEEVLAQPKTPARPRPAKPLPVARIPRVKTPPVDSLLRFDNPRLVQEVNPDRYARILNRQHINELTRQRVAGKASIALNRFVFVDDEHLQINEQPYPYGPQAMRVMHSLLENYLKGFFEVDTSRMINKEAYYPYEGVYKLLQRLALQKTVAIQQVPGKVERVCLLPAIFEDWR